MRRQLKSFTRCGIGPWHDHGKPFAPKANCEENVFGAYLGETTVDIRQARFYVAPFLFFLSILIGGLLANHWSMATLSNLSPHVITAMGGILGAATFPSGFILGGITAWFLRLLRPHLPEPSDQTFAVMSQELNIDLRIQDRGRVQTFFAEERLNDGVRKWLDRLWDAINTYVSCIFALVMSLAFAPAFGISYTCTWIVGIMITIVMLALIAYGLWKDCIAILNFEGLRRAP